MKICIATYTNRAYEHICAVTNPNKRTYAQRHGYAFMGLCSDVPYPATSWERHRWYLDIMTQGYSRDYLWLFCCDGDFIFTNFTIPIESLIQTNDDLIIAKDALMIQAGVMLVRNSEGGRRFLRTVANGEKDPQKAPFFDQSAIELYLKENPGFARIVPQRVLQSYEYSLYKDLGGNYAKGLDADGNDGQWQPGDFGFHVPAHIHQKIRVLKEHLPLVVK